MPQKVGLTENRCAPCLFGHGCSDRQGVYPEQNHTIKIQCDAQKDLLGHPQTKVFVAHGGINGVHEAIYHGIRVLGIPQIFDQFDNLLCLQDRGAGKIITLADVNGHSFEQGLKEVFHQDRYRHNMQRLSRLHKHRQIPPMDTSNNKIFGHI